MKTKLLMLAVWLAATTQAFAHNVIGISDGHNLTLVVDSKPLKVRLADIDAPEKAQAFGEASCKSLSALCFGKDADTRCRTLIASAARWRSSNVPAST